MTMTSRPASVQALASTAAATVSAVDPAAELDIAEFRTVWLADVLEGNPSTTEKGHRFAAKLITQWADIAEGSDYLIFCDGAADGGIDVAYLDRGENDESVVPVSEAPVGGHTWYLVQSKYGAAFQGQGTLLHEGAKVIKTFAGETPRLNSLSDDVLQRLRTFRQNAGELDRIVLLYATTEPLTADERRTLEDVKTLGRGRLGPLFDVDAISVDTIYQRLKDAAANALIHHRTVPLTAHLTQSGGELLVGSTTLPALYAFLKAYKAQTDDLDMLYEKNVRRFLGSGKKVNKGMQATLRNEPERFGLYNNGITIVVADFNRAGDNVELVEPYIVNGCQTTRSIWEVCQQKLDAGGTGPGAAGSGGGDGWATRAQQGVVVTKIVKVGATGEALLQDITRYTNSQNAVGAKDFLALNNDFKTWAQQMAVTYGLYLEIQRGGWDSQRAFQKQHPMARKFTEHANAFDLVKAYGAGWLGEAGLAFGKNAPFLQGGGVFKRIMGEDGTPTSFGAEDLYAAYLLERAADRIGFGRQAARASRRQTRFLFYFIAIDLLRHLLRMENRPHTNKDIARVLVTLFRPDNEDAAGELMDAAVGVIDEYLTEGGEDSVYTEPSYKARFNQDLNAFLKQDGLGKSDEATPALRDLLLSHRKFMNKAHGGMPSPKDIILAALG